MHARKVTMRRDAIDPSILRPGPDDEEDGQADDERRHHQRQRRRRRRHAEVLQNTCRALSMVNW